MTASENQTDSRQALVKRIERRDADIGTYLQRARRRRDRFSLVSMVAGAVDDLAGVKYRDSAAARPMDASAEELSFTGVVPDADPGPGTHPGLSVGVGTPVGPVVS
ncbi:hypothetical protein [Streptomyces sp. NPDC000851]